VGVYEKDTPWTHAKLCTICFVGLLLLLPCRVKNVVENCGAIFYFWFGFGFEIFKGW